VQNRQQLNSQVLVIGGGIAGLSLALRLAAKYQVTLLAKSRLTEGSSLYAQGGVAAVLDQESDSYLSHIEDTLNAGAGLCKRETVEFVVEHGPRRSSGCWTKTYHLPWLKTVNCIRNTI